MDYKRLGMVKKNGSREMPRNVLLCFSQKSFYITMYTFLKFITCHSISVTRDFSIAIDFYFYERKHPHTSLKYFVFLYSLAIPFTKRRSISA